MAEAPKTGYSRPVPEGARSVLISVDGSEHSKNAFNYYLRWLSRPDDAITIFHAIEPVSLPSVSLTRLGSMPSDEWSKIVQANVKRVAELETDYITDCQSKNLCHQFLYESANQSGEAIVMAAEKFGVHLLIMGSRGLGAIRRTILGSVSDYVLHHTNAAVCVIPCNVEK